MMPSVRSAGFAPGNPSQSPLPCLRYAHYSAHPVQEPGIPRYGRKVHGGGNQYCRNRLPVTFNPDADVPKCWFDFLMQLLTQEDIVTLQEFMGYCLIPSTKGQKMLFLIGQGGEGKSRIGVVMRRLRGSNMNTGSIAKVETQKFARADLEHILVMVDDDMKLEALPQTNNIKAIITAEQPMDLEKKGKQSYQGDLYVRFMVFGNEALQALYDRSAGFFRRQIILTTKERDPGRIDDPYLAAVEDMMVEIGIYDAPTEPTTGDKVLNGALKALNDAVYAIFGAKGFVNIIDGIAA